MTLLADTPVPPENPLPDLAELLPQLITPQIVYFPIPHHSPACARHVEALIRSRRPRAILVEGPQSFTNLIPLILHAKTRAPIAIYTSFVQENPSAESFALLGPPRFAAYYPFC